VKRRLLVVAAALAAACSDINPGPGGLVALEVTAPSPALLEQGDTVTPLRARGLDRNGDSIAAEIRWYTLDTAAITIVDSTTSRMFGRLPSGTGRVQARSGSLGSPVITFSLLPRGDTLVVPAPDTLRVASADTASAELIAQVQSFDPAGPVASRRMIYQVVDPTFAQPADQTVALPGGGTADTVLSGPDGQPAIPVVLLKVAGTTHPDSAIVEVRAYHLSGAEVAGSGQQFIVRFDP
jgi:hypothetical protein